MPARAFCFGLYLIAAAFAAITSWYFAAFTADDAYIVARYAVNARDLGEWAFNAGEPVSALTSPLHGLVLNGLSLIAPDPLPPLQGVRADGGRRIIHAAAGELRRAAPRGDAHGSAACGSERHFVDLRGTRDAASCSHRHGHGCDLRAYGRWQPPKAPSARRACRPCGADPLRRGAFCRTATARGAGADEPMEAATDGRGACGNTALALVCLRMVSLRHRASYLFLHQDSNGESSTSSS